MRFIQENLKQIVLLGILVVITGYAMFIGSIDMVDKILLAVLTALDLGALVTSAIKPKE